MNLAWSLAFAGAGILLVLGLRRLAQAASRRRARLSAVKRGQQRQQAARTRRGLPRFGPDER